MEPASPQPPSRPQSAPATSAPVVWVTPIEDDPENPPPAAVDYVAEPLLPPVPRSARQRPGYGARGEAYVAQTDSRPVGVVLTAVAVTAESLLQLVGHAVELVDAGENRFAAARLVVSGIGVVVVLALLGAYLSRHTWALRIGQVIGSLKTIALIGSLPMTIATGNALQAALTVVFSVVYVWMLYYNLSPAVEAWFSGRVVRVPAYFASWHFWVPSSVVLLSLTCLGGVAALKSRLIEAMEQQLDSGPTQFTLANGRIVSDSGAVTPVATVSVGFVRHGQPPAEQYIWVMESSQGSRTIWPVTAYVQPRNGRLEGQVQLGPKERGPFRLYLAIDNGQNGAGTLQPVSNALDVSVH